MCYSLFYRREKAADRGKDVASPVTERSAPIVATTEPMPEPADKERQKAREEEAFEEGMPA